MNNVYDIDSIFDAVVEANTAAPKADALYTHILKFPLKTCNGKDFVFRLVPFIRDGKFDAAKTFCHFIRYSWNTNGRFNYCLSNRTFKERCPIYDWKVKVGNGGSAAEQELAKKVTREEGWYVNVYVVDDPVNPANNGKVKILKLGKKVYQKVMDVFNGSKDEEWSELLGRQVKVGRMILNLTEEGINFVLKVRSNGEFQDYTSSDFTFTNRNLHLSSSEIQDIINNTFDTSTINAVRSYEECAKFFKETFLNANSYGTINQVKPTPKPVVVDDVTSPVDDDIPNFGNTATSSNDVVHDAANWLEGLDSSDNG